MVDHGGLRLKFISRLYRATGTIRAALAADGIAAEMEALVDALLPP